MDRTAGKDQPVRDQRASGGTDMSCAVSEYFSQLVRNVIISAMSCHLLGIFSEFSTVWQVESWLTYATARKAVLGILGTRVYENPLWPLVKARRFKWRHFHDVYWNEVFYHWMDATSSLVSSCTQLRSGVSFVLSNLGHD